MADERNVVVDRFACGCFLFALFSRSRWSDLRCVYGFASDIMEMDGKIVPRVRLVEKIQHSCWFVMAMLKLEFY